MMRFYNQQHRFYCGVDLHATTLSLCILATAPPTSLPPPNHQHTLNPPPFSKKLASAQTRAELDIPQPFPAPSVRKNVGVDLALIDAYAAQIADLELYLSRPAKVDDPQAYHRLRSVPGI